MHRNQCRPLGVDHRMSERLQLVPDACHPIEITPTGSTVVITRNGRVIAETTRALTLREATLPPAQYIPLDDVDSAVLERTDHSTYCPYKGEASYYAIVQGDDRADDAVWTYETPYDAVSQIAGHVAFCPHQVAVSVG